MTDKAFQSLLNKTAKIAYKHAELCNKCDEECIKRYGVSYSDVDADGIIDILNYLGGNGFSIKEFNEAMELSECKLIKTS